MRLVIRPLSVFCLAALLSTALLAEPVKNTTQQDAPKKAKQKEAPKKDPTLAVFAFPKKITLDEAQQTKVEELKKDYLPKLQELDGKLAKIMTPERLKARDDAYKSAIANGDKKGAAKAAEEALKLNDDEKAQWGEIATARRKLQAEIRDKKIALLTEKQKEELVAQMLDNLAGPVPGPKKDEKKPKNDKKPKNKTQPSEDKKPTEKKSEEKKPEEKKPEAK